MKSNWQLFSGISIVWRPSTCVTVNPSWSHQFLAQLGLLLFQQSLMPLISPHCLTLASCCLKVELRWSASCRSLRLLASFCSSNFRCHTAFWSFNQIVFIWYGVMSYNYSNNQVSSRTVSKVELTSWVWNVDISRSHHFLADAPIGDIHHFKVKFTSLTKLNLKNL